MRIVLSGYTDLSSVTDAINQGAIYKFLTKPWEDHLLRANVEEAFRHYELACENERLTRALREANEDLERRVEEKTCELSLNLRALQVAHEVLEHLPVAVLGIGRDGIIAVANRQARAALGADGRALVGEAAAEVLPVPLAAPCCGQSVPRALEIAGRRYWVHCDRLGQTSFAQGAMLVLTPEHAEAPA